MELDALRLFLQVAATGSFSRAAALASSTQSAVSKRIGALESELSARLFERTGRGARLTRAGRLLQPRAEALTSEVDGLADLIADGELALRGVVRLALQPSVGWPLVGDLAEACGHRHPGIRLQIAEGPTRQVEEWLGDGRIDLGIVSLPPPPELGEFHTLFQVPLMLVASARDPEVRRRTIRFSRLARLPLAVATMPNGGRVLLEEEARRAGVELNIALEVNSIHLLKKLVARGNLYSIGSLPSIAAEVAAGELGGSRITQPEIWQSFYLVVGGRRHASAAVQAIARLIRDLMDDARVKPVRSRSKYPPHPQEET